MSVLQYFKNTSRSPLIGRQAQSVIFFLQIRNEVPGEKKGACRPPNGRQAPFFFLQEPRCEFEEKKLHFGPVALWKGDRSIFLKYFKTEIYF